MNGSADLTLGAPNKLQPIELSTEQHSIVRPVPTYLVAIENFGDTAVRDPQLTADDARPDTGCCQFDDLQTNVVWQWSTVDEYATKLVHSSLAYKERQMVPLVGLPLAIHHLCARGLFEFAAAPSQLGWLPRRTMPDS